MKYPEEMYIDSQIFSEDMDGSEEHFSEKVIKTRKEHQCCICGQEISKGEKAVRQQAIINGMGWRSCYICIPCIEKWLDESGQILSEK